MDYTRFNPDFPLERGNNAVWNSVASAWTMGEEHGRKDAVNIAWKALERLRIEMETSPVMVSGRVIPITISGGVAAFCAEDMPCTPDALIARADKLLYVSKRKGRNRITA